ncbi:MAG: TadE/TadG family type IV pilus assembly protein [Planctomycetota bacterium]
MIGGRRRTNRKRRASVAVEFALTAPVFFMMLFACVEFSRVSMIQHAVENAAFEGARKGIIPGGNSDNCRSTTLDLLSLAGVNEATVTVSPDVIDTNTDIVTVTVVLPMSADNGFGISGFLNGRDLEQSVSLRVEQSSLSSQPVGDGTYGF